MAEDFYLPTKIYMGNGYLAELGAVAAPYGRAALLVCGRTAMRVSGILDRAVQSLNSAGVVCVVYDSVQGEPTLSVVEEGIALLRSEGCDVAVGLGGGSAMDVAKAIAGLAPLPGSVAEYHAKRPLEGPGLPFLAVPTTSGTGAEVTKNAVLIDLDGGGKNSIRRDDWFVRAALVDPELTLGLPKKMTTTSGSDTLCQFARMPSGESVAAWSERAMRGMTLMRGPICSTAASWRGWRWPTLGLARCMAWRIP